MPTKIHQSISISGLSAGDILQVKAEGNKIYTFQFIDPQRGEVWLKREHTPRVKGFILGSASTEEHRLFTGEAVLGFRLIFQNSALQAPKDMQALPVTRKVWLNEEIVLQ
jgi:hypothetical protein